MASIDHSYSAIRIANLDESITQTDVEDLVTPFGPIKKLYLVKEQTGYLQFAIIHFKFRNDAERAISWLGGNVLDHHSLTVDWSKPLSKPEDEALVKLKAMGDKDKKVKCRTCSSSDHWTSKCPWWKYTMLAGGKVPDNKKAVGAGRGPSVGDEGKQDESEYVPPNLRDGADKRIDGPNMARRDHRSFSIRIENLSDSTTQTDLAHLVKSFGPTKKRYLAKDKQTGLCKGFAYIHFKCRNDAAKAISKLDGHVFDSLALTVDWSKPLNKPEDGGLVKLKAMKDKDKKVKCRTCSSGDHWTSKCPWKYTMLAGGKFPDDEKAVGAGSGPSVGDGDKQCSSEYVPPNLRDCAVKRTDGSDGPNMATRDHSSFAIQIANLSDSTTKTDLEDLVKPFGPIQKLYLAKDKKTGLCKGLAYIHFIFRNDAAKAISMLDGHVFDHLILTVKWSKPLSKPEDEDFVKLKAMKDNDKNVKCRTCSSGDHWTSKCPWKYTMLAGGKFPDDEKAVGAGSGPSVGDGDKQCGSEYVPPNLRDCAVKRTYGSDGPNMAIRDHSSFAIRIANLSDSTTQTDLEDLVKPFGPINKLYLAKNKQTGLCKGFAFVHFKFSNDAAKAISMLDGHVFDHLILTVDWSKPQSSSNQ